MSSRTAHGSPIWIDLGTTDVAGAKDFYTKLFGWTIDELGPEAGGYGIFRRGGKRVAGVGAATDPDRGTSWAIYFATDDVEQSAARVAANGGEVIVAPMDVMDQGRMAVFTDPSGAFFSMWQPMAHRGAELFDEHGSLTWVELYTDDIESARSFYGVVLQVQTRDVDAGVGMSYTVFESGGRAVAGGMQAPEAGPPHWSVYFAVDEVDPVADQAIASGGAELLRQDSPAGRFATLRDPQGGTFSVIKNDPDFSI